MKLKPVTKHKLDSSLMLLSDVLREVKQKPLKGRALTDMKILEVAVQHLEAFQISAR